MNICNALKNNNNRCKIFKNTEKYNYQNKEIYLCKIHLRVLKNSNLKIFPDEIKTKNKQKKEIENLTNNLYELDIKDKGYNFCGKTNIYNFIKCLKKYNHILMTGSSGIGKTLSIKLIFDDKKYDIIYYEDECLFDFFKNNNNKSLKDKNKVIIVDNIEELGIDKINNITNIIKSKILNPKNIVIFICNDTQIDYKKINLLKKYIYNLKFNTPNINETKIFIKNLCINNFINIKDNEINAIILSKYNDIRAIINDILFYKESINNNNIYKKDINFNIFENLNKMTSKIELDEKINIFKKYDNLDMMLYENYCNTKNTDINRISNISQNLSYFDTFKSDNVFDNYNLKKYKSLIFNDVKYRFSDIRFPSYFNIENKRKRKYEKNIEEYYKYKKKNNTNISLNDFINYKNLCKS